MAASPSLTARLAGFAASLSPEEIPQDVRRLVTLHFIDSLGCALPGARTPLMDNLLQFLGEEQAAGPCPVPGTDVSFGPSAAALATATAMNALDYDDGYEVDGRGLGHPGATICAAALSAVWRRRVTGDQLLSALTAAFEINARLIQAIQPTPTRFTEVYGVCQHQSIAAALAYGRLAGLEAGQLANAMGLAGSLTCLPSLRQYNWDRRPLVSFKDFAGPAAETGVRAVQMSRAGLIGPHAILDGEAGFWRMIGSDRFDPDILTDGLGETWACRHLSIKPYPACRWMHTALESFQTVQRRHTIAAREIEAIEVLTSASMARDFWDRCPATMIDAQFSLPFALANLVLDTPLPHWHRTLSEPDHLAVAGRVEARIDAEIDAAMSLRRPAGQVVVRIRGGRLEGPRLILPRGTRERPLSDVEILKKFRSNAEASGLGPAATALEALEGLDEMDDAATALSPFVDSRRTAG